MKALVISLVTCLTLNSLAALSFTEEHGGWRVLSPKGLTSKTSAEVDTYMVGVGERLVKHWRSPSHPEYRLDMLRGDFFDIAWSRDGGNEIPPRATVQFTIGHSGQVSRVEIVKSSGARDCDQAVLNAVRSLAPLPPVPNTIKRDLVVQIEIEFAISVEAKAQLVRQ